MANGHGLKGTAWAARCFAIVAAALVAILLATPAEARRKFGGGSSSGSKFSGAASAAAPKMTDKMFAGLVLGRAATKAAAKRLTKVFDLPESAETRLPDGRYLHIGRLEGMLYGKSYVGYVSSTEYISLSNDALLHLIDLAGFGSLEVFEDHIASTPPPTKATTLPSAPATASVADAAVAVEPTGLSFAAKAAMGGLSALLLGFIGYCLDGDASEPGLSSVNHRRRAAHHPDTRCTRDADAVTERYDARATKGLNCNCTSTPSASEFSGGDPDSAHAGG